MTAARRAVAVEEGAGTPSMSRTRGPLRAREARSRMNELDRDSPACCVGAGRAATTLLHHLARAGLRIGLVANRSFASAARAVEIIGAGAAAKTLAEIAPHPLVVLGVHDAGLEALARALAEQWPASAAGRGVALHLSGALEAEAIAPLRACGLAVGSFHPMQAFADPARAVRPLAGVTFGIEGDPRAMACMQRLASALHARTLELHAADKPLYHASAVLAAGGLVALAGLSRSGLARCASAELAWQAIVPLLRGTLDNLAALGPEQALTGPIARGDIGMTATHLRVLGERAPLLVPAYRALALATVELAQQSGRLAAEPAARLRELLLPSARTCP